MVKKKQAGDTTLYWLFRRCFAALFFLVATVAVVGMVMLFPLFWRISRSTPDVPEGRVLGVTYSPDDTYTDHCAYRGNVPPGELCGEYQTQNLITEDSSFEVGALGQPDAIDVRKHMHYDFYNPGSGDMFSGDPTRGYVAPELTDEEAYHGNQSLRIDNTNADGTFMLFNFITVPTDGRYVFSMYAKAASVGGQVDDNDSCSNTNITVRLRVYDPDWTNMTPDTTQKTFQPSDGWKRPSQATDSDTPLQAGTLYRVEMMFTSPTSPLCGSMGIYYLDAAQFEYAQNQQSPAASPYTYQTSEQELYAYTSTDDVGADAKYGNFFFPDDRETIYSNVQIYEEAALESDSKLKWWLYDSAGDFTDTGTALDSGEILVSHNAANIQTVTQNVSTMLETAAPGEPLGHYSIVYELWNAADTTMIDKEFLIVGITERSPWRDDDRPDSLFGNHVSLSGFSQDGTYNSIYWAATQPLDRVLDIAQGLGVKSSREFYLMNKVNLEEGINEDPYFDDYVAAMTNRHIALMPVISGHGGPDGTWSDALTTFVNHYGSTINTYEVLNEPHHHITFEEYYDYLWRAESVLHTAQPNASVVGPSAVTDWLDDLLTYDDGTHGLGYDLLDILSMHFYRRGDNGFQFIPEDAYINWADMDERFQDYQEQVDNDAPGGVNNKPTWNSEFGIHNSRIYPDVPVINNTAVDQEYEQRLNMSGSLPTNRKIAADFMREHMYYLANDMVKVFHFGLFSGGIHDGTGYALFDHDNTPTVAVIAYAQLTRSLEGATYIRRIEPTDLRTNGVLDDYSRAFVFEAPDPNTPGQTRPVATVFNYDQEFTGAALQDVLINTDDVDIVDMEGNPVSVAPGSSFSVPIDMTPTYIIGKNGISVADMVAGLDQTTLAAPATPQVARGTGDLVRVRITENPEDDVASYNVYRKDSDFGSEELIGSVDSGDAATVDYYDSPTTGTWEYRVTAIELGSGRESPHSEYADPFEFSYRPVLDAIGDKTGAENALLTFTITATDSDSETLTFDMFNEPQGAALTDNGNKTATFAWTPNYDQAGTYYLVVINVSDGLTTDTEAITITISNTNREPYIVDVEDKTINEGDVLEFTVVAVDDDSEDTVTLAGSNLPEGASFADNGNRTGTFTWQPDTDQAGVYTDVTFTALDNNGGVGTYAITITVLDGLSGCTPDWQCTEWSACDNSHQTRECTDNNGCGTDADRPDEVRACDSTPPSPITNLDAF